MQTIPLLLSFLSAASATKLLLPLYVYPTKEGAAWKPVYEAIDGNPDLEFQVILNCNNGPGGDTPGYNNDWQQAVGLLNAYHNVQTLGYVYTSYGARATDDVVTDILNWANWNTEEKNDLTVDGIFFDQVPAGWDGDGGPNDLPYMANITDWARSAFAAIDGSQVIYNLGTVSNHPEYFDGTLADVVLVDETQASDFDPTQMALVIPEGKAARTSWLLYDFARAGLDSDTLEEWLGAFVEAGVDSVNILDYDYNHATTVDNPAALGMVAEILTNLQ
ncbi:hypothetical protein M406DRAFT_355966 [Cryphonectria parasitica EP155]|uniref:Uncharacterized protein n=1 Tax=Cryphonectria parasitica (strain ATCC 38755 / EP155) TaxID=660469 RepID=A0A9P5CQ12_CRYP1|nr:uncharacterized protein M406DRAFT_355966 [Cryphonectria parasitica EP155]KAF3765545.1 hypothetical protein M406DRAFT_355966 [Cryphonectria parasitica EP155]